MKMTMKATMLGVVVGCVVRYGADRDKLWRVMEVLAAEGDQPERAWLRAMTQPDAKPQLVPVAQLRCGFQVGMMVRDEPRSRTRRALGEGIVRAVRTLGGREQVLVELPNARPEQRRIWMPFERLSYCFAPHERYIYSSPARAQSAERFRLRALAHALEQWHESTGALTRTEIDPLPHQLHLVHHILRSGDLNWMIADDVGLGKTVEVGMLLSALMSRRLRASEERPSANPLTERVLIVTPAGLTQQWQEELASKFGLNDFLIYGKDFNIDAPERWRMFPRVIVSMDRAKSATHLEKLLGAEPWDVIIFDEAHRLTRRRYGKKYDASERFTLAAKLRERTDAMILLSATPHQGDHDKFIALLELLRPHWKEQFELLAEDPSVLRQCIYRNRKEDVTDAAGEFIFKGQRSTAVTVEVGAAEVAFDAALQRYFRAAVASSDGSLWSRAVGFVVTIFRKLAASSPAAILSALERRRARLVMQQQEALEAAMEELRELQAGASEGDARFQSEQEERLALDLAPSAAFFDGELDALDALILQARDLDRDDRKLAALMGGIIDPMCAVDPHAKLLIFTEFRGTQDRLVAALRERFGEESVAQINGDQDLQEKRAAVDQFRYSARFMVSTEAGGEGLNLHHGCHRMVNYDLPWNPMRMVQRLGRLYRYGQPHKVLAFNLHAPTTVDARVVELMYSRIDQVVSDLCPLSDEYHEQLHVEIFGQLASLLDVEAILRAAPFEGVDRTQERIDEALGLARDAQQLQAQWMSEVEGFDPERLRDELTLTKAHMEAFVLGMLRLLGAELLGTTHQGQVHEVRLPPELVTVLGGKRQRFRLTATRELANSRDIELMSLDVPLIRLLMRRARDLEFGGQHAVSVGLDARAIATAQLCWQSDQGRRMREAFIAMQIDASGQVQTNTEAMSQWLLRPAPDHARAVDLPIDRKSHVLAFRAVVDQRLGAESGPDAHPELGELLSLASLAREVHGEERVVEPHGA